MLSAKNTELAHVQVVAESLENVGPFSGEQDAPGRYQVVHGHFAVELDFPWDAIRDFYAFLVIKRNINLELASPLVKKTGKSHELGAKGIGRRAETLEDTPQLVIFGQNILLNIVAAQKSGNLG